MEEGRETETHRERESERVNECVREREREREREGTCIIHGVGEGIVSTWAQAQACDCVAVSGH